MALRFSFFQEQYDSLVVLDVETSGLSPKTHEIIELAAARLDRAGGEERYDQFIRLSPGRRLDPRITQLTGITQDVLEHEGIGKETACRALAALLGHGHGKTLLAAYNAQFDLSFLQALLARHGDPAVLTGPDFLDVLTVYKDRRPFPHKLKNAIEGYSLQDKVVNSHRAIDDVLATVEVLAAMEDERPDLGRYVNLFGFNPKYGVNGPRLPGIFYAPQPYGRRPALYDTIAYA